MTRVKQRVVIEGQQAGAITVGAAAANTSGALRKGLYAVWADAGDIFVRVARTIAVGGGAVASPDRAQDVTATNGLIIKAGVVEDIDVDEGRAIGAFSTPGTTVRYHRIGD